MPKNSTSNPVSNYEFADLANAHIQSNEVTRPSSEVSYSESILEDLISTHYQTYFDIFNNMQTDHAAHKAELRRKGDRSQNYTAVPSPELWNHNSIAGKQSELESQVRKYIALAENWDGDGAEAIPVSAVHQCLNYLDGIKVACGANFPMNVAPSPEGEILLYWKNDSAYAELNFDGDGECTLIYSNPNTPTTLVGNDGNKEQEISEGNIISSLKGVLSQNF